MCNPVALGAGQAIASTAGAVGGFQADQKQTSLVNQGRAEQYKQQLLSRDLKYNTDLTAYNARLSDYRANEFEQFRAYGNALADNQSRLNEQYSAANVASLANTLTANAASGRAAARGVAGQSAAMQMQSIMASLGRDESLSMDNLLRARYATIQGNERFRDNLTSGLRRAYNQIGPAPIPGITPPKPVFSQGPSPLALAGQIGSSALSGLNTTYDLAEPGNLFKFKG